MAAAIQGEKWHQENKTMPGHGFTLIQIYDTKSKNNTLVKAKVQGEELILILDDSNEEDITSQFKVVRGTKDYFKIICDRIKIVLKDGNLQLEFDFNGIKRIRIEAEIRAKALEETKKKNEEIRLQKERQKELDRIAEEKRKKEEEAKRREEERRLAEAAELQRKKEEAAAAAEAEKKRKAFEDKIMGAMLGVAPPIRSSEHDSAGIDAVTEEMARVAVTKTWSDEHQDFYFMTDETNELSWRDPNIQSVWEKLWDSEKKQFYYSNKVSHEILYKEPYSNRYDKVWVPEKNKFLYVNLETGDCLEDEPYY